MEGSDKDMRMAYSEGTESVTVVRWKSGNDVFALGLPCLDPILPSHFDGSFNGF